MSKKDIANSNAVKTANNQRGLRPPWQPGQTGNPGGRPKGLAVMVREKTGDGIRLVETMAGIADGKLLIEKRPPSHRDRIQAIEWLADRGFGATPKFTVDIQNDISVSGGKEPEEMTVPEMEARLAKMRENQIPILNGERV